ncbi:hypothetical protein KRX19_09085 [Cardiobacteriaceae bacterium TAE3-ERU3]|nr:hypothetical protein [Cardiobacteriaceae bacterium TAE3-ERU3]
MKYKNTFTKADRLAIRWTNQLNDSDGSRDRARLDRLMLQALPDQWQTRAISAGVQNGIWTLYVNNGGDAYQLRFLAGEIEARLASLLPHPPTVKIQVNPGMRLQQGITVRPPATLYPKRYTDSEAESILQAFKESGLG